MLELYPNPLAIAHYTVYSISFRVFIVETRGKLEDASAYNHVTKVIIRFILIFMSICEVVFWQLQNNGDQNKQLPKNLVPEFSVEPGDLTPILFNNSMSAYLLKELDGLWDVKLFIMCRLARPRSGRFRVLNRPHTPFQCFLLLQYRRSILSFPCIRNIHLPQSYKGKLSFLQGTPGKMCFQC